MSVATITIAHFMFVVVLHFLIIIHENFPCGSGKGIVWIFYPFQKMVKYKNHKTDFL